MPFKLVWRKEEADDKNAKIPGDPGAAADKLEKFARDPDRHPIASAAEQERLEELANHRIMSPVCFQEGWFVSFGYFHSDSVVRCDLRVSQDPDADFEAKGRHWCDAAPNCFKLGQQLGHIKPYTQSTLLGAKLVPIRKFEIFGVKQ